MHLALSSLFDLPAAFREWQPDAVVSILSPGMRVEPLSDVAHLRLTCRDLEVHRFKTMLGPSRALVEAARAFMRAGHRRLLVHCPMGLSRSPALAIVALVESGWSPEAACRAVREAVPRASPNRLILRLAEDSMGLDGRLREAASMFTFRREITGAHGAAIRWVEVMGSCVKGDPLSDKSPGPSGPPRHTGNARP